MGVTGLFVLAFLTAQVSCGRSSLTFVIDDTMSMSDEIQQVKNAVKSIVDIVLRENSTQIEDIVLVTFNDPGTEFRIRTRDENELKQALDSISVHNGGDCPEMALSGIKLALEESQPGSYLYVFTDASAKDYQKHEEIESLCQKKQSRIDFILSGYCGDGTDTNYEIYHKIAAACNGQKFEIQKHEVAQVLEYVKETIKGRRTVITSAIETANAWKDVQFDIDEQTDYIIVSATGVNVDVQVIDQHNGSVLSGEPITWTKNAKVLKLPNVSEGTYKARLRGNSNVNVMVFGRTDFTFDHGFSSKVETSLRATEPQPTMDAELHLMVVVDDPGQSINVESVEIMDMQEKIISSLPLSRVQDNVYATDKFLPPTQTFKIAVIGKTSVAGKIVRRTAKTPITAIRS